MVADGGSPIALSESDIAQLDQVCSDVPLGLDGTEIGASNREICLEGALKHSPGRQQVAARLVHQRKIIQGDTDLPGAWC